MAENRKTNKNINNIKENNQKKTIEMNKITTKMDIEHENDDDNNQQAATSTINPLININPIVNNNSLLSF